MVLLMQIRIRRDVLMQELDGEAVLLDMKTETYYRLNATGALAWPVLSKTGDQEAALKVLQERYTSISEERLRNDLKAFVEMLLSRGLAEQVQESDS